MKLRSSSDGFHKTYRCWHSVCSCWKHHHVLKVRSILHTSNTDCYKILLFVVNIFYNNLPPNSIINTNITCKFERIKKYPCRADQIQLMPKYEIYTLKNSTKFFSMSAYRLCSKCYALCNGAISTDFFFHSLRHNDSYFKIEIGQNSLGSNFDIKIIIRTKLLIMY